MDRGFLGMVRRWCHRLLVLLHAAGSGSRGSDRSSDGTGRGDSAMSNKRAFLNMIAISELGLELIDVTDNGYNVLVGSTADAPHTFDDYSTHPLPDASYAIDLGNGLFSTAAGRYQFLSRDWIHYRDQLGLPDFGPDSQDKWAWQLVKERKAVADIESGHIESAISKCNNIWASLPGNDYGQHQNSVDRLVDHYRKQGGQTA